MKFQFKLRGGLYNFCHYSVYIPTFAKSYFLVRIVQQNDWVACIIIGCILLYIFMLLYLHRDSSVREFLLQKKADSSNNFLTWLLISVVYVLSVTTLISQTIPIVPAAVRKLHFLGLELNKFGFTLWVIILFYLFKSLLSYLFFLGTGSGKKWSYFQFTAAKFYFTVSLVVMVLCIYQHYFPVNMAVLLDYYFYGFVAVFLLKIMLYLFSPQHILPTKWYYKFLYICTLQFAPVVALWSVLYF